jgi:hypothetical protein
VKLRIVTLIAAMIILGTMALPVQLAAQEAQAQLKKAHIHYSVTDLGTWAVATVFHGVLTTEAKWWAGRKRPT